MHKPLSLYPVTVVSIDSRSEYKRYVCLLVTVLSVPIKT